MFSAEDKVKIGAHLGELINKKYDSQRQFCKAYIEIDGIEATDDELRKMSNRISQIVKGKKMVQTYDLPKFSRLLEVTCEEILSAGECMVPRSNRMTNYSIAFSNDEDMWEKYIKREDKPFLNADEYGQSVVDYALQFKNYDFLKFLMKKEYIWFVDNKKSNYASNFGAGTSIEGRQITLIDNLKYGLEKSDKLRRQMISLAIKHGDIEMLDKLRAREIPSLYMINYFGIRKEDYEVYYDEEMLYNISKAGRQILDYFAEEFEVVGSWGTINRFVFPYMSELLNLLVKDNNEYAVKLMECLIERNRKVCSSLNKIINAEIDYQMKSVQDVYSQKGEKYIEMRRNDIVKDVRKDTYFFEHGCFVTFYGRYIKEGIITNIVHADETAAASRINLLIQELNELYDEIRNMRDNYEDL